MNVVRASYEIMPNLDGSVIDGYDILRRLELYGRTCYKSEGKITNVSCVPFIQQIIRRGHETILEHEKITVRFIVDRGVSHELVRHRIASYSQESTRYCNYGTMHGECSFILPFFWEGEEHEDKMKFWREAMLGCERIYLRLLEMGATPQEARSVLPNSLKTEIVMTANLREWRHFFKLRTAKDAHPQMREVTVPLLADLQKLIPVIFDGI